MLKRRLLAGTAAAALVVLTACGTDTTTPAQNTTTAPETSASSPAPASSSAPATSATPTPTATSKTPTPTVKATATKAAKVTPWGTRLSFGDQAVQKFEDDDVTYTVGITPVSVRNGTSADLSKLKDAAKYKNYTPVYVTVETENVGGPDMPRSTAPSSFKLGAVDSTGKGLQSFIVFIGTIGNCKTNTDAIAIGEKRSSCQIYLLPKGSTFGGYAWIETGKDAIVWKK